LAWFASTRESSQPGRALGGVRSSGYGREGGREGIEEYLSTKYVGLGPMSTIRRSHSTHPGTVGGPAATHIFRKYSRKPVRNAGKGRTPCESDADVLAGQRIVWRNSAS
jgi:hypothetical protein